MKKILLLFLALLSFSFSGCEKDDICDADTPTTPRLVITFYRFDTPTIKKNVTNLKVKGEGMDEGIIFNENGSNGSQYLSNSNTISLPLKTDADTCTFTFTLNFGNTNTVLVNEDVIKFNYSRKNIYVSRACGFKTIFELNSTDPIEQTDPANDGDWMRIVNIENSNIEYENETHISVYF